MSGGNFMPEPCDELARLLGASLSRLERARIASEGQDYQPPAPHTDAEWHAWQETVR